MGYLHGCRPGAEPGRRERLERVQENTRGSAPWLAQATLGRRMAGIFRLGGPVMRLRLAVPLLAA